MPAKQPQSQSKQTTPQASSNRMHMVPQRNRFTTVRNNLSESCANSRPHSCACWGSSFPIAFWALCCCGPCCVFRVSLLYETIAGLSSSLQWFHRSARNNSNNNTTLGCDSEMQTSKICFWQRQLDTGNKGAFNTALISEEECRPLKKTLKCKRS